MNDNNSEQNLNLSLIVNNGDFEKGSGTQDKTGWIGSEKYEIFQIIEGEIKAQSSIDSLFKQSGFNSLNIRADSFSNIQDNLYIRLSISVQSSLNLDQLKNRINRIDFDLSFFLNSNFEGKCKDFKVYITKAITDEINTPRLKEIILDEDTDGIWKLYDEKFEILNPDLESKYYIYINITGAEKDFHGECNFDNFKINISNVELLKNNSPLQDTNTSSNNSTTNPPQIEFHERSLEPIPHELRQCFEEYLNQNGIVDYDLDGLINDPSYPFAALDEMWHREGLDYELLVLFCHANFASIEQSLFDYLNYQGVRISFHTEVKEEPTLREVIEHEYGESTSSLLISYIKFLLSAISDRSDTLIDSPISESSSQLLAIAQAFKEKTSNIDQLRTLDLIETVLLQYVNSTQESTSNTLTPDEKYEKYEKYEGHEVFDAFPSLSETRKISKEQEDSAAAAILQLNDIASSSDNAPLYEFRAGKYVFHPNTQRRLNFVVNKVVGGIKKNGEVDYSKWLPGFFGPEGGVINNILAEDTQYSFFESFFKKRFDSQFEKYTTLDAYPELKDVLSSKMAKEIASKRFGITGIFKDMGTLGGAMLSAFIPEDKREGEDFETFFKSRVKDITDSAIKDGFVDNDGNTHPPLNVSPEVGDFLSSSVGPAGLDGFSQSLEGLKNIPTNMTETVGVNPFGDVNKNSLGSVFFPDAQNGLNNIPLEYSPSISSKIGDGLKSYLPEQSLNSLQKEVFNNPEMFKNSRFDGSFANNPEFQKAMENSGISNYRMPQIQDTINNAFLSNQFDKSSSPLDKLSTIGNQMIGNVDKRLNVPFKDNYSPLANLLPIATAPYNAIDNILSRSNSPFIPNSRNFLDNVYGPQALASKNIPLPTTYSPDTLSKLMQYEAPFKNDINPNFFTPSPNYQYNPDQLRQLREYQNSIGQGKGSAPIPNFIPNYIQQNSQSFSPEDLRQYQKYQEAMQQRGQASQPQFMQQMLNQGYGQQNEQGPTEEQLRQYEAYQQALQQQSQGSIPQQRQGPTPEQIEQYKKYQEAKKNGTYGKKRPRPSPQRQAMRAGQEGGEKAQENANKVPISGAIAGAVIGFTLATPALALPLSVFGAGGIKVIGTILGTEKNQFKEFIEGMAEFAGITAIHSSTVFGLDSSGNAKTTYVEAPTLWNRTLGRVFGKDYELGGLYLDGNSKDPLTYSAQNFLKQFSQFNLMSHTYAMSAYEATSMADKVDFMTAANNALKAKQNYYKFFGGVFTDDRYRESLGEDPTFRGYKPGFLNRRIVYDSTNKMYTVTKSGEKFLDLDPNKTLPSEKFSSKLLKNGFNVRSSAGGVWSGLLGLAAPLRGGNTGVAGMFDYFFINVPSSTIQISKSLYALLPKNVKRFLLSGFGGATEIKKMITIDYEFSREPGKKGKLVPVKRIVYDKNDKAVIEGYRSTFFFKLMNRPLFKNSTLKLNDILKKAGNVERKGFRRLFFGRFKKASYVNWDKRSIGIRMLIKGPGFLRGNMSKFLHFATNPFQYIQSKIKNFFISILKNIIKRIGEMAFDVMKKVIIKLFKQIGIKIAEGLLLSFGIFALVFVIFIVLSSIIVSTIATSNRTAYINAQNGLSTVVTVVGGGLFCGATNSTVAYDENGVAQPAHILNVPYINEKVLDPNAATIPDTERQSKIVNNTVKGGGNMCGPTSTAMVAGYFGKLPISGNSNLLQDYVYMDKGQAAKYTGVINPSIGCTSTAEGTTQTGVKGIFYNIGGFYVSDTETDSASNNSPCNETLFDPMIRYLGNLGITLTSIGRDKVISKDIPYIYDQVVQAIDIDKVPLIMSLDAPLGHITVIVGYTLDPSGKINGVVMNDPYANVQKRIDTGQNLDYTIGDQKVVSSSGDKPIYHLENTKFVINNIWKANVPANTPKGECPAQTTTPPSATGDHIIQSVWRHRQNHELSCEFASLATSLNAVGVDLGTTSTADKKIASIEDRIIQDNASLIDKSNPTINSQGNIATWGDPDKTFVGNLDINGVNVNPPRGKDPATNDPIIASPDNTTGLTVPGAQSSQTPCASNCGYGTYAPVIDNIIKGYTQKGIKVSSELLPRNPNNGNQALDKLEQAVDAGNPSIVWVVTQFEKIKDNEINALRDERAKGLFKWTSTKGKQIDAIPHEHAVVFMGYNKDKDLVYFMDVYKGGKTADNSDSTSARVEMSSSKFLKIWDLFDYQAVIIKKG